MLLIVITAFWNGNQSFKVIGKLRGISINALTKTTRNSEALHIETLLGNNRPSFAL